jgi:MFS family permease
MVRACTLLAVQFMTVLDVAIVNVALPSIQVDLAFSQEKLEWVMSAYALALFSAALRTSAPPRLTGVDLAIGRSFGRAARRPDGGQVLRCNKVH